MLDNRISRKFIKVLSTSFLGVICCSQVIYGVDLANHLTSKRTNFRRCLLNAAMEHDRDKEILIKNLVDEAKLVNFIVEDVYDCPELNESFMKLKYKDNEVLDYFKIILWQISNDKVLILPGTGNYVNFGSCIKDYCNSRISLNLKDLKPVEDIEKIAWNVYVGNEKFNQLEDQINREQEKNRKQKEQEQEGNVNDKKTDKRKWLIIAAVILFLLMIV